MPVKPLFEACIDRNGPQQVRVGKRLVWAHRLAWEEAYGEAPAMPIHHLCGNKRCVNVAHLELRPTTWNIKYPERRPPLTVEGFAARLKRDSEGCLLWLGARDAKGYGVLKVEGKATRAHLVAWKLASGRRTIPSKKCVKQYCGDRLCCEPTHLYLADWPPWPPKE